MTAMVFGLNELVFSGDLHLTGNGKGGQLDCTHVNGGPRGMYAVHKFFVQAMLDDYFETQHHLNQRT